MEERLSALLKIRKAALDHTPALRSIVGDRSRETHNYEQRVAKLQESLDACKQRQEKAIANDPDAWLAMLGRALKLSDKVLMWPRRVFHRDMAVI